jgi:hypothetical protein
MPCGPRARLTAYVAYQSIAFAERDVLLAALAQMGYPRVEAAPAGTESNNPVPVLDANRRVAASAALVIRREHLPAGFGDLGFVLSDGAYVPLVQADPRAERILKQLRTAYGQAKAGQLAEQASRRYRGSVHRAVAADGSTTIRVRF